jgi:[ribosomal protein S5]-alanine N-acetyltransferase
LSSLLSSRTIDAHIIETRSLIAFSRNRSSRLRGNGMFIARDLTRAVPRIRLRRARPDARGSAQSAFPGRALLDLAPLARTSLSLRLVLPRPRTGIARLPAVTRGIELRTERLLLRPFCESDVDDALAYRNDPEFARFLPHIPQPFTRAHAEAFVNINMTEPWDTMPTFAVVLDSRLIGTVNLEIDPASRTAMLGYAIARAHWGQGIAVEAATAAIAWALADVVHDLTEIWASTDPAHIRSRRVMAKLGMSFDPLRSDDRKVVYRMRRLTAERR